MASPHVATTDDSVTFPHSDRDAKFAPPFRAAIGDPARALDSVAWSHLAAIVCVAALLRVALLAGYFGSDDLTYLQVAIGIADGHWKTFEYVGALRYGVNLPNALFIKLFGASEFSANLWSLLCSVGEVALVFIIAHRIWGIRAAWLAGVVIGILPLHVHFGARAMADAPLAFFITLSFVLFWFAEQGRGAAWYVGAGLAAGFVFWIKEAVVIYWAVFAILALGRRTWNTKWCWFALAALLMVALNCLLMWAITGDPVHIFKILRAATAKYVHLFKVETSLWYYPRYLFVDIKHVWVMPFLALAGIVLWAAQGLRQRAFDPRTGYVVAWALGLFAVFSFMPISLSPLRLIAKQTNYMLIFTAPLCLLAGYALSRLRGRWLAVVLAPLVAGSLMLAALEQQVVRSFTANGKAAVAFAQRHPETPVYVATNNHRAGTYAAIMRPGETPINPLRPLEAITRDLESRRTAIVAPEAAAAPLAYAVVDEETMNWGSSNPITTLAQIPACWERTARLEPVGYGWGKWVVDALFAVVDLLPKPMVARLGPALESLRHPRPAHVYAIGAACRFSLAR